MDEAQVKETEQPADAPGEARARVAEAPLVDRWSYGGPSRGEPSPAELSRAARRHGTVAATLFIAAALSSVPAALLVEPPPPATAYLTSIACLLSGLACLAIPWERISLRWFHAVAALATAEVAVAAGVLDRSFELYFVFVAVFSAYLFASRRDLAAQLALIGLALFAPLLYAPEEVRTTLRDAALLLPVVVLTAAMIAYLRERLEASQAQYRDFAEEAFELAGRIRSVASLELVRSERGEPRPAGRIAVELPPLRDLEAFDDLTRRGERLGLGGEAEPPPRPRRRLAPSLVVVGAAGAVCALFASLALAGVRLPEFARAPFDAAGLGLPNQTAMRIPHAIELPGGKPRPADRHAGASPRSHRRAVRGAEPKRGSGARGATAQRARTGASGPSAAAATSTGQQPPAAGQAAPSKGSTTPALSETPNPTTTPAPSVTAPQTPSTNELQRTLSNATRDLPPKPSLKPPPLLPPPG